MRYQINPDRILSQRDAMIYGHFLEHFHRQIYGGVYEPASPLADKDGFRKDVLEALRDIRVPVIRWPGGCFASTYDWKKGVGQRIPAYDKTWRVEDSNTFGTDEFIQLCQKLDCKPYICTNAGTGTPEEMSDWMEYCNLAYEGPYAKQRIANGHKAPYNVKYWSIGNENYGGWELGAKDSRDWSRLVLESAKLLKHVTPDAQLSAAALADPEWNFRLLTMAGNRLEWISIHGYWDMMPEIDNPADYNACMAYSANLDDAVLKVKGMLAALGLEKRIKIAYDEWNLRSWHHPNVHTVEQALTKEEYLYPRDRNDINATYTMADAVFTGCFLNMLHRHADTVRMANYSPTVNTRGLLYAYPGGIVKRSTYYVFQLYTQYMFDQVIDGFAPDIPSMTVLSKDGKQVTLPQVDLAATRSSQTGDVAVAAINRHAGLPITLTLDTPCAWQKLEIHTIQGNGPDDYNDVDRTPITIQRMDALGVLDGCTVQVTLPPHSINVITLKA